MKRILIIDDNPDLITILKTRLEACRYQVAGATDGMNGLEKARGWNPDLIVLDIVMPGMDGYEVCRRLRENGATCDIPIIMLTGREKVSDKVEGFTAGADDYLTKPVEKDELLARIEAIFRRKNLQDHLKTENAELKISRELLRRQSFLDERTGLPNQRFFKLRLKEELARAVKHHEPLTCVLTEIDDYAKIKLGFGEQAGAHILEETAKILMQVKRPEDILAHFVDSRFALLFINADQKDGMYLANALRESVKNQDFRYHGDSLVISLSIGITGVEPWKDLAEEDIMLLHAEQALKMAQHEGRDRCHYLRIH